MNTDLFINLCQTESLIIELSVIIVRSFMCADSRFLNMFNVQRNLLILGCVNQLCIPSFTVI